MSRKIKLNHRCGYVIYNDETTIRHYNRKSKKDLWVSEAAAKAEMTRSKLDDHLWKIATSDTFSATIELKVRKRNIMSGNWFTESVNTPGYLSPSSETYWSR